MSRQDLEAAFIAEAFQLGERDAAAAYGAGFPNAARAYAPESEVDRPPAPTQRRRSVIKPKA